MKRTLLISLAACAVMILPLQAAPTLNAGNYPAQLSPAVDSHTASNVQKGLDSIQEVDNISVDPAGSTVQFHVKDGHSVDYSRIQSVIQASAPNAQLQQMVMLSGPATTSGASGSTASNNGPSVTPTGT